MKEKEQVVEEFYKFWEKCEFCFNLLKKLPLIAILLGFIFLAIYIPIKEENFSPLGGIVIFLLCFLLFRILLDTDREKTAKIFLFFGAAVFIYSYFLIAPINDNEISFLTDSSHKLKKYGYYNLFHFPLYDKNFNYNIYQQRSFDYPTAEAKIIIGFEFNFDELFKHGRYVLVSEVHFDALIDNKVNLVKQYIERIGPPRSLSEFKKFNDPWLKITSLKIEFKPIVLQ